MNSGWLALGAAVIAVLSAAYVFLTGRKAGKDAAENTVLKDEIRSAEKREDDVVRADDAADRVRVDNADAGKLRDHDPFERR